jgi:succinoglycan biosynthesis transport protein ExoP
MQHQRNERYGSDDPLLDYDSMYDERILTLRDYLVILRRHRRLIAVTVLLAVSVTMAWSLTRTPLYQASALIALTPVVGIESTLQQAPGGSAQAQIDVLTAAATRQRVEGVIGRVEDDAVSFEPRGRDTAVILIRAVSADPRRAALVANTYAEVFADVRRESDLERNARAIAVVRERFEERSEELRRLGVNPVTGAGPTSARTSELLSLLGSYSLQLRSLEDQAAFIAQGRVTVIDPAGIPRAPFTPQPLRDTLLALLVGILVSFGLALLRDYLRNTIEDDLDVRRATGLRPIIGRIPMWRLPGNGALGAVTLIDPTSIASEAYRELSTNVRFLVANVHRPSPDPTVLQANEDRPPMGAAIMVVSAGADNGKSVTAVNLAVAAARAGQRVILVDSDLRRTAIAKFFGLGRLKGLSDAIVGNTEAGAALIAVGVDNLKVLPAGSIPPNPTDLLAGRAMERIHEELARTADLIIYDTPAALAVPDVLEIGRLVDGALLIVRHGSSTRREVTTTIERLETLGISIIGTVLNGISADSDAYYQYYASYYSSGYARTDDLPAPTSRRERRLARRDARGSAASSDPAGEGDRVRTARSAPTYGTRSAPQRSSPGRPTEPPRG